MWYDFNNGNPVQLPDGAFPEDTGARSWQIKTKVGRTMISTVFLGLDHNHGHGPPVLYETMIFGNKRYEDEQWRYYTLSEAKIGHEHAVQKVEGLSGLLRKL